MIFVKLQFSKRLRQLREQHGWSQKQLGLKTWKGLDPSSAQARISHYESDRHKPSYEDLERLAKVLNVSALALLANPHDISSVTESIAWNALMGKRPSSLFDMKIVNDEFPPYLKGQVLRVDPTLKPKHGDHVIVSYKSGEPKIREFLSYPKRGNFFAMLSGDVANLHKEDATTHVFGVIISHTIFHR